MQPAKNVTASAKAGMDKTKATVQEKVEKMTTRDPLQKELATEKKEAKLHEAELQKQQARGQPTAGGIVQDYPQGMGGTERGTVGLGSGGVGPEDPNVAGGARTGYGSGNTI